VNRIVCACAAATLVAGAAPLRGQESTDTAATTHRVTDTIAPATARAARDTVPRVTVGGFVDGYYAYDVDRPPDFDRSYTTQPARHDEFNINLAYVDVKLSGPRYRGRLAVQFGTSVQEAYFDEPRLGVVSGPTVSQYIQEGTVGYQLVKTLWVDGGIFLAHTGYEGWISRDNLTYTRSLVADNSPYYEAGVKLTWTPTAHLSALVTVLNGWQDISNYNTPKAFGARVDYNVSPILTLSYDNFVGNMAPDSVREHERFYNDFTMQLNPSRWQLAAVFDIGLQTHSASDGGIADWYGTSLIAKYHFSPVIAVVGRVERYADPSQIIVTTDVASAFKTSGGSVGVDVSPARQRFLWRTEVRGYDSDGAVWPEHRPGARSRTDLFAVSSLALTL
jgi:hypothetical protein